MGKCLESVGVIAADTRDRRGRYRFLPTEPAYHLMQTQADRYFWFWEMIYYPAKNVMRMKMSEHFLKRIFYKDLLHPAWRT